jgi:hypothetical protein
MAIASGAIAIFIKMEIKFRKDKNENRQSENR